MGVYRIRVSTGDSFYAGSNNEVYLWLVGQHGEASLGKLLRPCRNSVSCPELGLSCSRRGRVVVMAKSEKSLGALMRGPLTLRKARTASESGKGAQRHSVSAQ